MKITCEKDTKENRIANLNRFFNNGFLTRTLFNRAYRILESGKSIIYYVNSQTNKVTKIKVK